MSLSSQCAADVSAILASGDCGEAVLVGGAEVTGIWSVIDLSDLGEGFLADVAELHVPAASTAIAPVRGDAVLRLLDATDWTIEAVTSSQVWHRLRVLRNPRPAPRR